MNTSASSRPEAWPSLPLEAWRETYATLHLWTQIVGKIRLSLSPWVNHSWHTTLYVTARGLTTSAIPYGNTELSDRFRFSRASLWVRSSDGGSAAFALEPQSVASFYKRSMEEMHKLDLAVRIHRKPNELPEAIPFDGTTHRAYDAEYANRFWQVLEQADRVFKDFRARFIGKCSPVHFFWGAPDLAVTRFSGRKAPQHPGGVPNLPDWVAREAYSHEVSSCGFWPGGGRYSIRPFIPMPIPNLLDSHGAGQTGQRILQRRSQELFCPMMSVRQSKSPG